MQNECLLCFITQKLLESQQNDQKVRTESSKAFLLLLFRCQIIRYRMLEEKNIECFKIDQTSFRMIWMKALA